MKMTDLPSPGTGGLGSRLHVESVRNISHAEAMIAISASNTTAADSLAVFYAAALEAVNALATTPVYVDTPGP